MSLKRNVIANYAGQGYSALIAILIYPLFLQFLGKESYGLLGFFMTLQAWLILFDIGVTPALSREAAKARVGKTELALFFNLLKSVEIVFIFCAVITLILGFLSVSWIASSWLNIHTIPLVEVEFTLSLMFVVISLQWFLTLYRSVLNGLELQVWLNKLVIVTSTVRYPVSLVLIYFLELGLVSFVIVQLLCSIFELVLVAFKVSKYKLMQIPNHKAVFSKMSLVAIAPFALRIGLSTGVWLFVSQFDRLILSNVMLIGEYGYFTLVMVVVSCITRLTSPVSVALLPRFSSLVAAGSLSDFVQLYRKSTRLLVAFICFLVAFLVYWSEDVLMVWTSSEDVVSWSRNVLPPYVIGTGVMGILAFQYYMQFAFGNLKYHVYLNIVLLLICVPGVAFSALHYGAVGTAYFWLMLQLSVFFVWPAFIHGKFVPGLHLKWLFIDVLPVAVITTSLVFAVSALFTFLRVEPSLVLITMAFITSSISCIFSVFCFGFFLKKVSCNAFKC